MSWIVAGLIAGVLAYLADYVMWGKVFTRGMEQYGTMERAEREMAGMLAKSAALTLAWAFHTAVRRHGFARPWRRNRGPEGWAGPPAFVRSNLRSRRAGR